MAPPLDFTGYVDGTLPFHKGSPVLTLSSSPGETLNYSRKSQTLLVPQQAGGFLIGLSIFYPIHKFFTPTKDANNKEGATGRTDFQKTCGHPGPKSRLADEDWKCGLTISALPIGQDAGYTFASDSCCHQIIFLTPGRGHLRMNPFS
jgi:hypothetical protein